MRNTWIKAFQIISIFLLVFLAVSTFIPQISEFPPGEYPGAANGLIRFLHLDQFYNSPLNAALWGLLSLIIIGSVLFKGIRSPIQKIIHIILAISFMVIAIEKSSNQRFDISIQEGETIHFAKYVNTESDKYDVTIKLLNFEIQMHPGHNMPKAFISHLLVNGRDTIQLAVNKPVSIGHYRLYQSAYDKNMVFNLNINGIPYPVGFGDSITVDNNKYILEGFDHQQRVFHLKYNDDDIYTSMQKLLKVDHNNITIMPGEMRFTSIIDVAEIRWTKLLLLLGLLYIAGLARAFWRR